MSIVGRFSTLRSFARKSASTERVVMGAWGRRIGATRVAWSALARWEFSTIEVEGMCA
jgi:hypothetical protein